MSQQLGCTGARRHLKGEVSVLYLTLVSLETLFRPLAVMATKVAVPASCRACSDRVGSMIPLKARR